MIRLRYALLALCCCCAGVASAQDFLAALQQQAADAQAACEAPRRRLTDELEPSAARIWKQLESLAGAAAEMQAADKKVRELSTELKSLQPERFATQEEFRRYDSLAQQLTTARRALERAQSQRRLDVRKHASQSAEGKKLLAELAVIEKELVVAQSEFRQATVRATTAATRLKHYTAPPPPPGKIIGDDSPLKIQPPPDAPARARRFAERNSPENVAQLAREFFARVDVNTPGLEKAKAALAAGQHEQALDAWRDAFFARLREPQKHGLPDNWGGDLDTASLLRQPDEKKLAAAMENLFSTPRATAQVGPPGGINWGDAGPDLAADPLRNAYLDFYTMRGQAGFVDVLGPHLVLLEGYAATGEAKYLQRWAAVLDDWAMNAPGDMERSPFAIRQYPVLCSFRPVALASTLTDVLQAQPDFARNLPAPTLARIMLAVMEEYPASYVRLARRGIYNWRCIAITGAVLTAQAFPEFTAAQWQLAETKRLMELNWSHKILRDGANLEQGNWGHEPNDQVHLGRAMELLEAHPPAWMNDAWRAEWRDNMQLNARYYLHTLKPDGYTYKFSRVTTADKLSLKGRLPGERWPIQANLLLGEPEARRRLQWLHGSGGTEPPQVLSEALPYFGAAIFRSSWEPDAAFLYFHASPNSDTGGREDACGFALHAYGHALVLAPPLAVDDRTQNIHDGLVRDPGGKTVYLTYDHRQRPVDARFHASPRYDFAEGAYRGAYQFHQGPAADIFGDYGYTKLGEERLKTGDSDEPIRDVSHARQVLSVRGEDLTIVVDRWTSERERKFSQNYTLFSPIERQGWKRRIELAQQAKRPPLVVDEAARSLRTDNHALPSASVRHFGGQPTYTVTHNSFALVDDAQTADEALAKLGSTKLKKWTMGLPLPFDHKVRADWTTRGAQVLVTAIAQRPGNFTDEPFAGDLRDVESLDRDGVVGFRATTRRDARVTYLTSAQPATFTAGPIEIAGEALLVVERDGEPTTGVVLGASRLLVAGKPHAATGDFEFALHDGQFTTTPVHRPIQPVEISPAASVFTDTLRVELASSTPGVEIRYTLDGSDPTHASPIYRAPLTIESTTRVKARAFRAGLTHTPWTADGTQATDVSSATFEKQPALAAVEVVDEQPGLAWEYLPGRWAQLFADAARLPATKTGASPQLIDVSMRDTDGAFAVRASGYLHVPADGVYTLHAPREWLYPDNECGYELQVALHDRPWQPATRRHGHGTWSLPLKQGAHPLQLIFIDFRPRTHKPELWDGFPHRDVVWTGDAPKLEISGPGLAKTAVPAAWLTH